MDTTGDIPWSLWLSSQLCSVKCWPALREQACVIVVVVSAAIWVLEVPFGLQQ